MDFEKYKERALKEFNKAKELRLIDKKILSLLELINSLPNFYTTSSCSGRITVDVTGEKKKDHLWLIKTHKTINFEKFLWALELINKFKSKINNANLKVDSFILHIGAKTIEDAEKFLNVAKKIGLKRTGIIQVEPRIIIEIVGLDRIEMPLFLNGKFLISKDEEVIKNLVGLANEKLIKNWERIKMLEIELRKLKN